MTRVTLVVEDKDLATPYDAITDELRREWHKGEASVLLMVCYPAGDVDTIAWPLKAGWEDKLVGALYDAREMGLVGSKVDEAELPDGSIVRF